MLSQPVRVTSIVIEHIGRDVARNIHSAPHEFVALGYTDLEHLDVAEGLESGYYEEVKESDADEDDEPVPGK